MFTDWHFLGWLSTSIQVWIFFEYNSNLISEYRKSLNEMATIDPRLQKNIKIDEAKIWSSYFLINPLNDSKAYKSSYFPQILFKVLKY